jgi:PAS domain S-box-containing protein
VAENRMFQQKTLPASRAPKHVPDDPLRFGRLIDAVGDYAIFMLDLDGKVVTWSAGAERINGYSSGEMVGQTLDRLFTDEDRRRGAPGVALDIARREGRCESEGWRVRKDGSRYWALSVIEPIRDETGGVAGFAKITRDITERHAALEALAESERRFRLLVNAVVDYAIYMLDAGGVVTQWNPGAERIKGYTAAEIVGRHFSCFYTEEDRRAGLPERALETARREGKCEAEGWRVRKDGTRFWANVVIDAVRDEGGNIIGFAKITRDRTEWRHQQQRLEQTREALHQAQKMEALGQLTGGIAHDFNNILAAVMNNLELARRGAGPSADLRRHLDAALQAAQNGAGLVQQMLVFARKQPLRPQPVDVNAAVVSVVTLLRHSCREDIEIAAALDPAAPWVSADPHQLQTALLNLALNARDAMPDGGSLRIATAADAEAPGSGDGNARFACISIADTGLGMKPDVLAHAFEPFFTTKEIGKGTGLGLSMVYGAVRQLGGEVTLESTVGRGTTVRLFLPAAQPAAAREEPAKAAPAGDGGGTPLLFVEDDAIVNLSAVELLEGAGYRVHAAGRGDAALKLLDRHADIGTLVTDIGLPGMNGQELAAEARRRRPGLKVLFITGYDRTGTMGQKPLDADTLYIVKPYEPAVLFDALHRLMRDKPTA